jgi:hypothetical protein
LYYKTCHNLNSCFDVGDVDYDEDKYVNVGGGGIVAVIIIYRVLQVMKEYLYLIKYLFSD